MGNSHGQIERTQGIVPEASRTKHGVVFHKGEGAENSHHDRGENWAIEIDREGNKATEKERTQGASPKSGSFALLALCWGRGGGVFVFDLVHEWHGGATRVDARSSAFCRAHARCFASGKGRECSGFDSGGLPCRALAEKVCQFCFKNPNLLERGGAVFRPPF